jgi:uncharacterized phage protein gp47/JayE
MPLTELGYQRPTYDDLLEAQIERAKLLFGEDIDTNENTPLGKYIRINVADLADVYELAEKVYYSRFPNTSTGVSLDRLCPFVGIARNPATYALHNVRFIGVAGEYVPAAFEVSTADGALTFHTYESLLIGEDGTVDGVVECEQAGTIGNVALGRIDTILNPDANVESIEHLGIKQLGEEIETDTNLRYRFSQTTQGAGSSTKAAIKGAILKVPLVGGAEVVENYTEETKDGIPPHSFECFVLSPESQDVLVAEAIFSKKPIGIKSHGDIEVNIVDADGVEHTVSFSRTIEKKLYVNIAINTNTYFEEDGAEQIKSHIVQYINTLKNGENVYLSSLYGYIYKAAGVVNVSSLTISTDGSTYGTSDIEVASNEVARISEASIEVVCNT